MFEKLERVAIAEFDLIADGPVLVQSGKSNKINPTLPDSSFLRGLYYKEETLVIPGSTIKGVIRSYVSDTLDPTKQLGDNEIPGINNLFGCIGVGEQKSMKSKISFHDAYAVPEMVVTNIRYNTAISKFTQSAGNKSLNTLEIVEQGVFKAGFKLINFDNKLKELECILDALEDVNTGLVRFGGRKSRGFGKMKIGEFSLRIFDGYNADLSVKNEQEFTSFESAVKYVKGCEKCV